MLVAALTWGAATFAVAQAYKCKDGAGKTVYSGKPCEYGDQPMDLTDNVVGGSQPPADPYRGAGPRRSRGDSQNVESAECKEAQRALLDESKQPVPDGLADAHRQRQKIAQLSEQVRVICGSSTVAGQPRKPKSTGRAGDPPVRCSDGKFAANYESCGQWANYDKPMSTCPDGSRVRGTCAKAIDGSYYGR